MLTLFKKTLREPLGIIGAFWSLALLAPYISGVPTPMPSGFRWRQELVLAFLLALTFAFLVRQVWQHQARSISIRRAELYILLPLSLFVLWNVISAQWATYTFSAIQYGFKWIAYLIFFLLALRVVTRPRLLYASIATLAIVVWIIGIASLVEVLDASSLLFQKNGYGEPQAIITPIFAALALHLRRRRAALFCGATAVMAWLTVLGVLQRASFIAATVALVALFTISFVMPRWRPRNKWRVLWLLLAFAVAAAVQMKIIFPSQQRPSVLTRIQTTTTSDPSTNVRLLFWQVGLEIFYNHPLNGVGANNYEVAFPEGRAQFSAKHPNSSLTPLNEEALAERAHNEYIQILAELGFIGFLLFALFCAALIFAAIRALRYSTTPLAPGAFCALTAFAISSGASSASFRWMGSGLLFFFAAAIVSRFAARKAEEHKLDFDFNLPFLRLTTVGAFILACAMLCGASAIAANSILHATAQRTSDGAQSLALFRHALLFNPYDAGTRLDYGVRLFYERQPAEALPHLRFAIERGMNASVCYALLAAAEAGAGDVEASEKTLAFAVSVYPRSIFLRARHATTLENLGRHREAEAEMQMALSFNAKAARGWQQLLRFGIDAIKRKGQTSEDVLSPGELQPQNCVLAAIAEFERYRPIALAPN